MAWLLVAGWFLSVAKRSDSGQESLSSVLVELGRLLDYLVTEKTTICNKLEGDLNY